MQQEAGKKNKKWLWIVAALAVLLAVVGIVLALVLPGSGGNAGTETGDVELYWNIDRALYTENAEVAGTSAREPASDGNYHIRFAHGGGQVELQIADKQLVNYIDQLNAMSLVFDGDGVVIDAVEAKAVATEVANGFYISKVEGDTVTVNSSVAMNGMELKLTLTESTGVYDVSTTDETAGQICQVGIFDQLVAYANEAGELTHVYVTSHPAEAEVYWRVERCYDTTAGRTTREPDENGVYTIGFSYKGELVDLKCKDESLVNEIDTNAILQGQFALIFDEEGYIIDTVDVGLALRGTFLASDYHVTAIDGDSCTLTKLSAGTTQGDVKTVTLAQDCEIFQCCQYGCYGHNCGEYTDGLQLYDRVNVYADLNGNAIMIFVTRRTVDSPMYYNIEPKYGSGGTTRTLQNGFYVFEFLVDGKVKTLKVKDKALAEQIDYRSNQCWGLEVDGDIITRVYDPGCVYGGTALGNKSLITAISGPVVQITHPATGDVWSSVLSTDCKIYNAITGEYGKTVGGEMELQLGDSVTTYRNHSDEICIIFITSRPVKGAKVYYNLERAWNSETSQTKREPDAEGYYVFLMACEGKQVTVKTKDKGMASFIDSQNAPLAGLKVNSSGVITNAYAVTSVLENASKVCNYHYVDALDSKAGTFRSYYMESGEKKYSSIPQWKIAKDCAIYNVSTAYSDFRGEVSALRNGDQIQGIQDALTGELTHIFIMNRDATFGYESYKAACAHCGQTVTWEPYNGVLEARDGHYYVCDDVTLRQCVIGKEDDGEVYDVVVDLKGHSLRSSGRAFLVYDRLTVLDSVGGGKLAGTTPSGDTATSGSTVMVLGGELNILSGELTLSEKSTEYGKYGGVVFLGSGSVLNMSGGSIVGGTSTNGGNLYITGGTFNMTGGSISGGSAGVGSNILAADSAVLNIAGGTVDGGIYIPSGTKVTLSGKTVISGDGVQLAAGVSMSVQGLTNGASVVVDGNGVFTEALTDAQSYLAYFKAAGEGDTIVVKDGALNYVKQLPDFNSVDNSPLVFTSGTKAVCPACGEAVEWTALTGDTAAVLDNGHYYLASDVTWSDSETAFITGPGLGKTACVHLNGHSITATAYRAIEGKAGTLNIMGDGTVSGSFNADRLFGATVNMNGGSGTLNLIGGTYTKNEACSVTSILLIRNGDVNMYAGAQILGVSDGTNRTNVQVYNRSFNLYGGKLSGGNGAQIAVANWSPTASGILNIHGGEVVGTVTVSGAEQVHGVFTVDGGTITGYVNLSRYVDTDISGGTFAGTVNIDTNAKNNNSSVTLSGAPIMSGKGLVVPADYKLTLGALTGDAAIGLTASGVFTQTVDAVEQYISCFTPAEGYEIVAQDGALSCRKIGEPEPAPESDFVLDSDGDGYAVCPACGADVQWQGITDAMGANCEDGGHYYLAADQTSQYQYFTIIGKDVCLHLNNKDLTYASRMFVTGGGTLNIMGSGTVTSAGTGGALTGAITVNGGTANLYGGTYSSEAEGVPVLRLINSAASAINVCEGAVIEAAAGTASAVAEMGTVTLSGSAAVHSISVSADAKLVVKADYTGVATASFAALAGSTVPAANGVSEGEYTGTLTLDTADGPAIVGKDGLLVIDSTVDPQVLQGQQITAAANAMHFPTDATASVQDCPVCGSEVTWAPLGAQLGAVSDSGSYHYYLTGDITSQYQFITQTAGTVCLHINGYDVDVASRIFLTNGDLNIMGTGAVTCLGTSGTQTGAVTVGNNAVLSLYGCTVASTAASGTPAIRLINGDKATVNVYAGTTVGGEKGTCTGANIVVERGTLNLYGGTVQNGTGLLNGDSRQGGNIYLYAGTTFSMHAGTVTGGTAAVGGNICAAGATLNIYEGAVISGGETTSHGGNIHLLDSGILTTSGKITGGKTTGEAAHGGNISVSSGSVVICGGEITDGIAAGQGGNIRAWNATVTMTDGVISGGDSVAGTNDNVWVAGSSVMTMLGGAVQGTDGSPANGTAIFLSQTGVLYLGGDAVVSRDDGTSSGNIYVVSGATETAALRILNDWTGTASVKWSTGYTAGTAVDADRGSCGTLAEGVYTQGGSYTGTLVSENDRTCTVIGEDGTLKLAATE